MPVPDDPGSLTRPGSTRSATEACNSGAAVLLTAERRTEPAHELATHCEIARRLARLKGLPFTGTLTDGTDLRCAYYVPVETLVGGEMARRLGIKSEHDLFGGVVPHAFVATKAVSHPLVSPGASAPNGWSHAFPDRVAEMVLPGVTAFSQEEAVKGGTELLQRGAVRGKAVEARGGLGQFVARDHREFEAGLEALEGDLTSGVVIEVNYEDVETFSVGRLRVGDIEASYVGTQRQTRNNDGGSAYGGSELLIVRGGFDALLRQTAPSEAERLAIEQARSYDAAADECFSGLIASRRNYDVAQGVDPSGGRRSGVLEQSWRVGGASPAEVLALEVFQADPSLEAVRASVVETYGGDVEPPKDAEVFYHGDDAEVGPILKYGLAGPV